MIICWIVLVGNGYYELSNHRQLFESRRIDRIWLHGYFVCFVSLNCQKKNVSADGHTAICHTHQKNFPPFLFGNKIPLSFYPHFNCCLQIKHCYRDRERERERKCDCFLFACRVQSRSHINMKNKWWKYECTFCISGVELAICIFNSTENIGFARCSPAAARAKCNSSRPLCSDFRKMSFNLSKKEFSRWLATQNGCPCMTALAKQKASGKKVKKILRHARNQQQYAPLMNSIQLHLHYTR